MHSRCSFEGLRYPDKTGFQKITETAFIAKSCLIMKS
jgi:hypothetical protein